jgi:hypothetical protein
MFLFFFFLSTELIALEVSLGEEDETEKYLASETGEKDFTGEEGEGSTRG